MDMAWQPAAPLTPSIPDGPSSSLSPEFDMVTLSAFFSRLFPYLPGRI